MRTNKNFKRNALKDFILKNVKFFVLTLLDKKCLSVPPKVSWIQRRAVDERNERVSPVVFLNYF
jgi:Tfp pilus assembly protein PilZ